MFVPRTQLFFNFLNNLFGLRAKIVILPLLLMLPIYVTAVRENRCMVGGKYLLVENQTVTQPVKPNMAVMQGVGDKKCGFQVLGWYKGVCLEEKQVDYIAADVESGDYFCSFWERRIVCVCPDYGCNSVEGIFYETLIRALTEQGTFKGFYSQVTDIEENLETVKLGMTECLLQNVEKLHRTTVSRVDATGLKNKPETLDALKSAFKGMFPLQKTLEKLKEEEQNGPPTTTSTTTPTTTGPAEPASVQASALASAKDSKKPDPEDESWGVMPLVITVVLFVVVLALVAAMIIAFICFRRKVNDNLTTIRSVASDTSLHGSVMFSPNAPNAPPSGDYFANPNLNSGAVAVAPVAPNTAAAPSQINKSLMASPNPATVSRK